MYHSTEKICVIEIVLPTRWNREIPLHGSDGAVCLVRRVECPREIDRRALYACGRDTGRIGIASPKLADCVSHRTFRLQFPKASERVDRDWARMLTYFAFPKEHWRHLRTINVVESPFAAVRLRTSAAKQ